MSPHSVFPSKPEPDPHSRKLGWLGQLVLKLFVPVKWREPLIGDLLEEWTSYVAPTKRRVVSNWWFWKQVVGSIWACWRDRIVQVPRGVRAAFFLALLLGWIFAFIDSRPNWDDTGVLAFGILITCGILGALEPKRPWTWGVAVGVWIPLHNIVVSWNFESLLALVFAVVGAHVGAFARNLFFPVAPYGDSDMAVP